ncbi:unnamed protein product, partial [Trichobilharzia regenti]
MAKLLQRIRDICVNTGGLVLHVDCGSSTQFTVSGQFPSSPSPSSHTSLNNVNNMSPSSKVHINPPSKTVSTDDRGVNSSFDWCSHDTDAFDRQLRLPYIAQREI